MPATKVTNLTFRAGVAKYDEDTKICTPLPVQGQISIKKAGGDGEDEEDEEDEMSLYELIWKPMEKVVGDNVEYCQELNLMLIPDDTQWVSVKSCKNGRVFALVYSSNQKYFFWLQEKNATNLSLNELSEKDKCIFKNLASILSTEGGDEQEEVKDEKKEDIAMIDA
ncbi:proteasome regulatory particle lid subunit RPN13 NDAI_0J02600 [Naumovozyma dairenensis CBS 421]|uniref:Pru domain-containing protein n=1 Tax=Naumovozyma dairenensis (strain ATCC 10597 / BCRC 20456 / CBS 421 / NBRC 0211 / NRRL Y-12639) TaxID=1071378 RepID=G0WH74_NAUDC|nr:hypothetical protein NDAI_0J02600 [Naumovozyma dairenensis CBS 421]CCD27152.1 hypothetical protein NDAI_0J02600 [Naumovozyma dairenensis CBS 421]